MSDPKKKEVQPEPQTQLQTRQEETATIAAAVAQKVVEAVLPGVLSGLNAGKPPPPVAAGQRYIPREAKRRCDTCGWFLKDNTKTTCDEHDEMVVYPRNEEFAPHFLTHGLKLSGVKFMSDHPTHVIKVPKGAKSTLQYMLEQYERAEKQMRLGRTKKRRGPSAIVSPHGVQSNPRGAHSPSGWE